MLPEAKLPSSPSPGPAWRAVLLGGLMGIAAFITLFVTYVIWAVLFRLVSGIDAAPFIHVHRLAAGAAVLFPGMTICGYWAMRLTQSRRLWLAALAPWPYHIAITLFLLNRYQQVGFRPAFVFAIIIMICIASLFSILGGGLRRLTSPQDRIAEPICR